MSEYISLSDTAWKVGGTFPIRTDEDGTPLHPITGTRMVEVSPGVWMDPIGKRIQELMDRYMQKIVEEMASAFDK